MQYREEKTYHRHHQSKADQGEVGDAREGVEVAFSKFILNGRSPCAGCYETQHTMTVH